jgi:hypothetical protein
MLKVTNILRWKTEEFLLKFRLFFETITFNWLYHIATHSGRLPAQRTVQTELAISECFAHQRPANGLVCSRLQRAY